MADEQAKARVALAQQAPIQQAAAAARNETSQDRPSVSKPSGFLVGRRTMIAAAAAIVLGLAAYEYAQPDKPSLPMPMGQDAGPEYLAATLAYQPAPQTPMPADHSTWQNCMKGAHSATVSGRDLVLAIDTTGSMGGVIDDVKGNVTQLISTLRTGSGPVRVGIVAYRDIGDDYVVRPFPLTLLNDDGARRLLGFVSTLQASGGGDWPEAVDQALGAAAHMNWRPDVPASVVVIADAPGHAETADSAYGVAQDFASTAQGGQVSLIDTGSGADAFMRTLAKRGGGQYVTYDGHILNSLLPAITACPSR